MSETNNTTAAPAKGLFRYWPLLILAIGLGAYFYFDLGRFLSFEQLKTHRGALQAFVADQPILALALFVGLYATVTAFSLPAGALISVAGGFLFGSYLGTAAIVVGATLGATGLFMAAQSVFRETLQARAGPLVQKLEAGFKENALSYLLVLRLVPLFPFFVVNIVPALLGVRLSTFVIGTFFGIIPGTFVFASIGAGLGSIFDRGERFTLAGVLTPEIIVALLGLAALSLIPVVYKAWTSRRTAR